VGGQSTWQAGPTQDTKDTALLNWQILIRWLEWTSVASAQAPATLGYHKSIPRDEPISPTQIYLTQILEKKICLTS
jgi:hypothetical protein